MKAILFVTLSFEILDWQRRRRKDIEELYNSVLWKEVSIPDLSLISVGRDLLTFGNELFSTITAIDPLLNENITNIVPKIETECLLPFEKFKQLTEFSDAWLNQGGFEVLSLLQRNCGYLKDHIAEPVKAKLEIVERHLNMITGKFKEGDAFQDFGETEDHPDLG